MSALSKVLALKGDEVSPRMSEAEILELVDKRRLIIENKRLTIALAQAIRSLDIALAHLTPESFLRVNERISEIVGE